MRKEKIMMRSQVLITAIVAFLITAGLARGQSTRPSQAPTTKAASISQEQLNKLNSLKKLPRKPTSRDDAIKLFRQTRQEVFAYGEQLIASYPQADNLHVVYLTMIGDANVLYRSLGDLQAGEKLQRWSRKLLAHKTA